MTTPQALFIGGSAGSFDGLRAIFAALPREYPWPIAAVVHVPESRTSALPAALAHLSSLEMRDALDKEEFVPGTIYFAPPGYHLLVDAGPKLALSIDAPVNHARPSLDVLFTSAAEVLGGGAVAVVLSGANEDGAEGCAQIRAAGGRVYVEAPESSAHRAMPAAALARVPDAIVASPSQIAEALARLPGSDA